MTLGEKIREERKKRKITQKELANRMEVSSQVISNWERDYTKPSYYDILNLSTELNISTDYLIGKKNKKTNIAIEKIKNKNYSIIDHEITNYLFLILQENPSIEICYKNILADSNIREILAETDYLFLKNIDIKNVTQIEIEQIADSIIKSDNITAKYFILDSLMLDYNEFVSKVNNNADDLFVFLNQQKELRYNGKKINNKKRQLINDYLEIIFSEQ